MLARATNRFILLCAVSALITAVSTDIVVGGGFGFGRSRAVGGITIDSSGVLRKPTEKQTRQTLDAMKLENVPADLKQLNEIRKVSLKQLEMAIASSESKDIADLPDAVKYMAGIQRIKYVFVYPEQNDIVLAGPGEGWKVNDQGIVVGESTGRPVVLLEDLLVAFRSVHQARQGGVTCSIDPTAEGRRRFREFISQQSSFRPSILDGIAKALGQQQITLSGVPESSHYARVLVAADYHMKSIAMQLSDSPVKELDSYLAMMKKTRMKPTNIMPRWWLASDYEPLAKSDDGLAWEIRGQGVKAMTEDEFVDATGNRKGTGKVNKAAQRWADNFTSNFDELSQHNAAFGDLRNLMDLNIVATVIEGYELEQVAGCEFGLLRGETGLKTPQWHTPKSIEPQCSFIRGTQGLVVSASGGVEVNPWKVVSQNAISDVQLASVRVKADSDLAATWWWN